MSLEAVAAVGEVVTETVEVAAEVTAEAGEAAVEMSAGEIGTALTEFGTEDIQMADIENSWFEDLDVTDPKITTSEIGEEYSENSILGSIDEIESEKPENLIQELTEKETLNNQVNECAEHGKPIQNKIDGLQREADVRKDLEKQYPSGEGNDIISEAYLRDENGNIVKDADTGKARRIDFVVVKDGKVIDSIEVTSETADKTEQIAKETRIRDNGGNYIKDNNGNLIRIPDDVNTRIERRK